LGPVLNFPRTSAHNGGGTGILSLRATFPPIIARPTSFVIASEAWQYHCPHRDCLFATLLAKTQKGRAFSGREDGHNRLVGAGFSGTGCPGDEAPR
ncbi:MAG: hypothetical protein OEV52_08165, partial [Dehalococcoidia bacterium]|nr:hypothetical protein [Dehalococcoidia bacterium]